MTPPIVGFHASFSPHARHTDWRICHPTRWFSGALTTKGAVHYSYSMDTVGVFARYPEHLKGKEKCRTRHDGYPVVISEVTTIHGDGTIPRITNPET